MTLLRSKPVIILGAGGHAKVCIDTLQCMGKEILGVVAPKEDIGKILDVKYLGDESVVSEYDPSDIELVNGIGLLPGKSLRKKIFEKFKEMDYKFLTIIHPFSVIACDVVLQEGVQIMAGSVIQPSVKIGYNTIINTKTSVDHDCTIGDHCHLAPGVTICGGVSIGSDVFIGCGSTVVHEVEIHKEMTIRADSCIKS